ncbi:T9SS type A sorting domain-containing protein [Flavobacterium sp. CBA20B-1]|uniref:T9SS type A sorting domain-containing protein n=1 Tax=unclassified Flavobacterium TaxID=196869 RepID=UPI002225251E|nr:MULTISPECIES: T9SS type A sorting domain-containing protein [unclassified Flavobacterium]WCM41943.1 T9SS type A sorting domain-containing protein [Flavobacterium sp. CBA20B-1]
MKQKIHKAYYFEQREEYPFKTPKISCLFIFFLLLSLTANAQQPYEWQWAMKGGGSLGGTDKETIHDVKVGSDGNYYFIASIFGTGQHHNAQLDGVTVQTNNQPNSQAGGLEDIFLFSTDCEGNVRWSQAIGGGSQDLAYNLVLDSENNVYIGGYFNPGVTNAAGTFPVRFSSTDSLPMNNNHPDYYKRIYLVKYDSDGNYQGKKALQGNVGSTNSGAQILDLAINDDILHFVVGLLNGTHLDNQITVPSTVTAGQYYLAKYDTDLNYISSILLPVTDGTGFPTGTSRFTYDESTNTYYIAGERRGAPLFPLTYDGQTIVNRSFIIAINGNDGSKKWIREIYSDPGTSSDLTGNKISSVIIDESSNVYIGGTRFRHPTYLDLKIYDPTDSSVTPYNITTGADYTVPMIVKFNSDGDVQWVQATAAFSTGVLAPGLRHGKGIAINNDEVAFAAQASAEFWGTIEVVRPVTNYQPDPILVRLDKQTGNVIGVHDIEGEPLSTKRMTAVAVDNDGNYITGGSFNANLFMNNTLGINPLISTGEADFFVAKLANSACGSVSTDDFNTLSFNVYPNPTTSIINVETTEQLSAYTIYDATGRLVQESMFDSSNQINMENNSNGVYFIKIVTVEGNTGTVKVVKR